MLVFFCYSLPHPACFQVSFSVGFRPAGSYSIELSNLVFGGPFPAGPVATSSPPFTVSFPSFSGTTSYPGTPCSICARIIADSFSAIGGAVTGTTLKIAAPDRLASPVQNRKVVVSFITATALSCGDTVSISFPNGFLQITYNGRFQSIASASGISGDIAVTDEGIKNQNPSPVNGFDTFVIAVSGDVPAGPQTVTLCGLIFQQFLNSPLCGVSVRTSRDWTTTFAPTGTIGAAPPAGRVFAVSLSIPWDSRIASRSAQTAVFAFSTMSALPAGGSNSIIITFPPNFFVSNTASSCGIIESISANGIAGFSFSGNAPSSTTTFVLSGSAALPAGSYAVTFSGVTFGTPTAGLDTGITVQTSVDAVSQGAPSGPLSGYQVLAFTLPTCLASLDQTCQSATLTFLSNANPIPATSTLTISFSGPAQPPISGTVEQFTTSSGAVVAGAMSGASRRERCQARCLQCCRHQLTAAVTQDHRYSSLCKAAHGHSTRGPSPLC
jgi:hypothetical protein